MKTFIFVTCAALIGMALGALFGFAAGKITPDFFRHIIPWQDVEPVGIAAFFGATAGVILGGGWGCFCVIVQPSTTGRQKQIEGISLSCVEILVLKHLGLSARF